MLKNIKKKITDESGLGTLEIVLIIAVLVTVALIFRAQLSSFAQSLINKVFDYSIIDGISY
ncbi:MAG: hypothetical protein GX145_04455 [Clostridiaceae bacterium]|jgi:hypothetical protein|nr:Flp1 family type IVb pilin [Bacillota bacterium]NLN52043.1 hypothetical protein [Clostridiaceae bacterium]